MGDPPNQPDDVASLEGPAGDAVARGVMDENTKRRQYLREAVQQLQSPDGQPAAELVRDVAGVIAGANSVLNGTSWDPAARAEYGEWQSMEGSEVDYRVLVAAADRVRRAGEELLSAADEVTGQKPTEQLEEWDEGNPGLERVVEAASAARRELSPGQGSSST